MENILALSGPLFPRQLHGPSSPVPLPTYLERHLKDEVTDEEGPPNGEDSKNMRTPITDCVLITGRHLAEHNTASHHTHVAYPQFTDEENRGSEETGNLPRLHSFP